MKIKDLILASNNQGKLLEMRELLREYSLSISVQLDHGVKPAVETGTTFAENAVIKAKHVLQQTGCAAIADDSGLAVDALHGKPGIYSARYAGNTADDVDNRSKLLAELSHIPPVDRTAHFICVIALALPNGETFTVEGQCDGWITTEEQGESGFGYDPLFYYAPLQKTFAEMSQLEKNEVSHRGQAIRALKKLLKNLEK